MEQIVLRPIITEKLTKLSDKSKMTTYGFIVKKDANKIQIRAALEQLYDIEISSIRTVVTTPRVRRRYSKTGVTTGKSSAYKKAYITLTEPKDLDFYKRGEGA